MKTFLSKLTNALLIAIFISVNFFHGGKATNTTSYPITNDEPERGYNPETGRLVFLGGKTPIHVPGASGMQSMKVQDRSMVALNTYGPEFGLTNPSNELRLQKTKRASLNGDSAISCSTMVARPLIDLRKSTTSRCR